MNRLIGISRLTRIKFLQLNGKIVYADADWWMFFNQAECLTDLVKPFLARDVFQAVGKVGASQDER